MAWSWRELMPDICIWTAMLNDSHNQRYILDIQIDRGIPHHLFYAFRGLPFLYSLEISGADFTNILCMMTSSNGNISRITGHLWGKFTGHRWIPSTKASDAELWCFFELHLDKRLSKPWRGRWFETASDSLWRHCNEIRLPFHFITSTAV